MIRIAQGPFKGRRFNSERAYRKAVARRRGVTQVRRVPLPPGTVIIGKRRPPVQAAPFDPQIPDAITYYLIQVDLSPAGHAFVYVVRTRGQRELTDAQIDRELREMWEAGKDLDEPDDPYATELAGWRFWRIYRA